MNLKCLRVMGLLYGLMLLDLHVHSLKICGSNIYDVLGKLCKNGYNPKLKRTSVGFPVKDIETENMDLSDYGLLQPLDSESTLMRILLGESSNQLKTRRRRDGVYYECCAKPCSYNELLTYCKPQTS